MPPCLLTAIPFLPDSSLSMKKATKSSRMGFRWSRKAESKSNDRYLKESSTDAVTDNSVCLGYNDPSPVVRVEGKIESGNPLQTSLASIAEPHLRNTDGRETTALEDEPVTFSVGISKYLNLL